MTAAGAMTPPRIHNGTYTLSHPERGHVTLKLHTVARGKFAGKRILSLLTGSDNETSYTGVGYWFDDEMRAVVWRRFRGERSRLPIDGYNWDEGWSTEERKVALWADLAIRGPLFDIKGEMSFAPERSSHWAKKGWEIQLAGRCAKCNKKLTDPESIRTGLGPKCGGRT